jgi:hypothetical protein
MLTPCRLRLPPDLTLRTLSLRGLLLPTPQRPWLLLARLLLSVASLTRLTLAWLRLTWLCLRSAWLLTGVLRTSRRGGVLRTRLLCSPHLWASMRTLLRPRTRLLRSWLRRGWLPWGLRLAGPRLLLGARVLRSGRWRGRWCGRRRLPEQRIRRLTRRTLVGALTKRRVLRGALAG